MGVIGAALVLGGALFFLRFCSEQAVPPLPPAPVTTLAEAKQTSLEIGERGDVYAQRLLDDSRRFDIGTTTTPADMSLVFPHRADRTAHVLKSGESVTVLGLRLSLAIRDMDRRSRQMELVIDNQTQKTVAFRIVTRPSKGTAGCNRKENVRHNAIVLKPGEIARRAECIYKRGTKLEIGKVETIEVPPLSYFYLSAMPPVELGLNARSTAGHRRPTGVSRCQSVLPARVRRALERGDVLWRDLADFYARHSCEKYRFPHNYRAFDKPGAISLPAVGSVR